jgi:parvulin-like peptidyl-prolyl isomerase
VTRTPDEATNQALAALRRIEAGEAFAAVCREVSECPSKLKGGDMAGDVGWLDREKGADVVDKNKTGASTAAVVPPALLGPAFSLAPGQTSDLIPSEEGVHILQRTA